MDSDGVWRVIDDQRGRFAELLADLSDGEWRAPSLCAAWTVRDIAAHLTLAQIGMWPALRAMVRARGNFDAMIRDTALRQARLPVEEFPRKIRAMIGSRRTAPFVTELEPLIDVLVHTQDVARPLGRHHSMPVDAAVVAADRVWRMSFPFRARRRLAGYELVATDAAWRVGAGRRIEGPIAALLLLLTGRSAAAAELSGTTAAHFMQGDHSIGLG
jgi:uncharacterized protein (TIGR03083 family)